MTRKIRPTWFDVGKSDALARKEYRPPETPQSIHEMYRQGYESVCPLRVTVVNGEYVYLDARNHEEPVRLASVEEANTTLRELRGA